MITKTDCYNVHLTFGEKSVDSNIDYIVNNNLKGYVCVADINVIANCMQSAEYRDIVNNATFNTCDGSFLAFLRNIKYQLKPRLSAYNGPEIFKKYIKKQNIKQLLIGPSNEDFLLLKGMLHGDSEYLYNMELPFLDVEEFDYKEIAHKINSIRPDIVWVLLGAPKQEKFIKNIIPHTQTGLYFGVGAALNFFFGRVSNRTFSVFGLRFIWLERIFKEPKKQIKRIFNFIKVLPKIIKSA